MEYGTMSLEKLCELYRGEVSACETYRIALDSIDDEATRSVLKDLELDHARNLDVIRQQITVMGGSVPEGSGPWGAWAKMVTGASRIAGDKATLKALKEGEEHGIKEYEEVANVQDMDPSVRNLLRDLIPKQNQHIQRLNRCMNVV